MFEGNRYYGHGRAIKEWASWPRSLPLPVALQHGWASVPLNMPWYQKEGLPQVWLWTEQDVRAVREERESSVKAVGAPWLYHPRSQGEPGPGEGVLVFPVHGAARVGIQSDWTSWAVDLARTARTRGPVTVCMYQDDLLAGRERPFLQAGLKVTTLGNRMRTDYLDRWFDLVEQSALVVSNGPTTALLYAGAWGRDILLEGPESKFINLSDPLWPLGAVVMPEAMAVRREQLRDVLVGHSRKADQKRFCLDELGMASRLGQVEMHQLLVQLMDQLPNPDCGRAMWLSWLADRLRCLESGPPLVLVGSGSHSRMLLRDAPWLCDRCSVVLGDQVPGETWPLPVVPEADWEDDGASLLILSSRPFQEEMVHRFLRRGVAAERLFCLYGAGGKGGL